ncbi:MAG: hypothetical protein RL518_2801 [Pseudomonadota bacterium]|jgi:hypothetical protein
MFTTIDSLLLSVECKLSKVLTSILVAGILFALANVYVTPAPGPVNHGQGYADLAHEPFNFMAGNALQNRILTPLVAHYLFPSNPRGFFALFVKGIGTLFIALMYLSTRKEGLSPTFATLIAAIMTFSAPTLFFIHFAGYPDVTSYLLVFLAMLFVRNNLLWPLFLSLALLNHERNFFMFPWFLVYYYLRNNRSFHRTGVAIILMGLSAVPWFWYVQYVASFKPPQLSASHYLNLSFFSMLSSTAANLYTGCFQAFKLFWAIPLYATFVLLQKRQFAEISLYVLIVLCAGAQLAVANDTSRLVSSAFPVIWLGFLTLAKNWQPKTTQVALAHLFLLNLFVPQYYVGQNVEIRFYSVPWSWLLQSFFLINPWRT